MLLTTQFLPVQNNIMEIRTDALKLLVILRRPVPRAAATVGAWLHIFKVFIYFTGLWKVMLVIILDVPLNITDNLNFLFTK